MQDKSGCGVCGVIAALFIPVLQAGRLGLLIHRAELEVVPRGAHHR